MTMPVERARAMLWAGGFLIELARDHGLPLAVTQKAVVIARHFPTIEDVAFMLGFSVRPAWVLDWWPRTGPWAEDCRFGPLCYATRLAWPE